MNKRLSVKFQQCKRISVLCTVMLACVCFWPPTSESDQFGLGSGKASTKVYVSGTVTDKYEAGIQVNMKNYHLHKTLIIRDEEGRSRDWTQVRTGWYVQIHLKHGKIDEIIHILPK